MKKLLLSLALVLMALCLPVDAFATDIIYGNCHYRELNGQYAGVRKTESYTTFETDDRISLVYCLRIPKATVSGVARLTPKVTGEITLNITVTDCETGDQILEYSSVQEGTKGQEMTMPIIPDTDFPQDTWYRVELKCPDGYNLVSRLTALEFERTGSYPVCDAHKRGFPTPATHLWFGHSTEEFAPQNESYEWCYQECLMPEQWATINTYLMTLGITGGYSGMQMAGKTVKNEDGLYTDTIRSAYTHQVLFSIWDNGDTDITPNLPDYLRAGALTYGDGVKINHFGNEGTGCQAMITNAKWTPGQWVQFLALARPEECDVTLKNAEGNDSIIKYPNSLLSMWYKTTDDPTWHYIATIRHSGESHYWNTWYSFIENWSDTGGELFRRAYYRNNYQRSLGSGKWYYVNKAGFSQTTYADFVNSGEITSRQVRKDYGHGLAGDVPRAFFMQAGGYGQAKDSLNILPLVDDHSVVESINLDSLKTADILPAYLACGLEEVTGSLPSGLTSDEYRQLIKTKYIDKINLFGGYAEEDMADVVEAYNDESVLGSAIRRKMLSVGRKCMPLKYGNTKKLENVCSFKAYQIKGNYGVLVAEDGQLSVRQEAETDVTDPNNNWLVIRHDDEQYYCLYNLGAEKYITFADGEFRLSSLPCQFKLTRPTTGFTFRDNSNNYIAITRKGALSVAKAGGSLSVFQLYDNYYMTPDPLYCYDILAATTSDAIEQTATGIDEISTTPEINEDSSANLSDDILAVAYYDMEGRRVGYALSSGTYIARILLKNGSAIVRKIVVK